MRNSVARRDDRLHLPLLEAGRLPDDLEQVRLARSCCWSMRVLAGPGNNPGSCRGADHAVDLGFVRGRQRRQPALRHRLFAGEAARQGSLGAVDERERGRTRSGDGEGGGEGDGLGVGLALPPLGDGLGTDRLGGDRRRGHQAVLAPWSSSSAPSARRSLCPASGSSRTARPTSRSGSTDRRPGERARRRAVATDGRAAARSG